MRHPLDSGVDTVGVLTPASDATALEAAAEVRSALASGNRQAAVLAALAAWDSRDVLGCTCGAGPARLEAHRPSWAWRHALAGHRIECPCGLVWSLTGYMRSDRKASLTLLGSPEDLGAQLVLTPFESAAVRGLVREEWVELLMIETRHRVWELVCERERGLGCVPPDVEVCASPAMLDHARARAAEVYTQHKRTMLILAAREHGLDLPESARWWTRADNRVALCWD